jgi:hypothetical protein
MKTRGGKRIGSGRKLKYNEPTVTISFKVPESKKMEFKEFCNKQLKNYEKCN